MALASSIEAELKSSLEKKGFFVDELRLISNENFSEEARVSDINCFFNIERCKVNLLDTSKKEVFVWYKVQTKSKAMYLKRSKRANRTLNSNDVEISIGNNFRCGSESNTVKKEITGSRLKFALKQESVLCLSDIASGYAVYKGEDVKLVSLSNDFKIEMKVVAMSSGNLDDKINVRVRSNGKIIPAIVVALNTVRSLK